MPMELNIFAVASALVAAGVTIPTIFQGFPKYLASFRFATLPRRLRYSEDEIDWLQEATSKPKAADLGE